MAANSVVTTKVAMSSGNELRSAQQVLGLGDPGQNLSFCISRQLEVGPYCCSLENRESDFSTI